MDIGVLSVADVIDIVDLGTKKVLVTPIVRAVNEQIDGGGPLGLSKAGSPCPKHEG